MKQKWMLPLLGISPILLGYLYNWLITLPALASVCTYLVPVLMLVYWLWAGMQFAKYFSSPFCAIMLGNAWGIVSLVLYIWQRLIVSEGQRILFLSAFSQMFSAPLSMLSAFFAVRMESYAHHISDVTFFWMQVFGLMLMISFFGAGCFIQYRRAGNTQRKKRPHTQNRPAGRGRRGV
ncbi:MAG: hypothetical protein ACOYJC_04820 [Christensenellales bacterium]|jgi:hypothetical protein